jgi:uncharacterized protein
VGWRDDPGCRAAASQHWLPCRQHKTNHELDVVVSADTPQAATRVLAIGEVKTVRSPVGLNQLRRLKHVRSLMPVIAASDQPKLLLFARRGFTSDLVSEARVRPDVQLIDLERLYHGSRRTTARVFSGNYWNSAEMSGRFST